MDSNNFKTYRINKTGKTSEMISSKDGEWIRKSDVEYLLWEFNSYKEKWTLENANLQIARIIDNMNLDSNKTLALHMLSSCMLLSMASIKESDIKDKQLNIDDKGKESVKI